MTHLTLADIELAKVYFEILVGLAKSNSGQTIEYGELVTLAKEKYPGSEAVKGALAVSTGRRLGVLREKFTIPNKLPDLSALVLNKSTKDNGGVFARTFDANAIREEIASFDWSTVQVDFEHFIANEKLALEQRQVRTRKTKKVKEPEARLSWWEYYKANKAEIGPLTEHDKEAIIKLIMQGQEPLDALNQVRAQQRSQ